MIEVIGIGLNRTGTTTLKSMLQAIGYNTLGGVIDLLERYRSGESISIEEHTKGYNALEDVPWFLMWRELYDKYPDAKYILTVRKDPETYYKSHVYHLVRPVSPRRRLITAKGLMTVQGCNPLFNKDRFIEVYNNHNNEIISFFKDKKHQFLKVCWEDGDGWKEICNFLGKDIPNIDMPHEKKLSYVMYDRLVRIARRNPDKYLGMSREECEKVIEW